MEFFGNIFFLPFGIYIDEGLVLGICDLVNIYIEGIKVDGVHWAFIVFPGVTSHFKFACRYSRHTVRGIIGSGNVLCATDAQNSKDEDAHDSFFSHYVNSFCVRWFVDGLRLPIDKIDSDCHQCGACQQAEGQFIA